MTTYCELSIVTAFGQHRIELYNQWLSYCYDLDFGLELNIAAVLMSITYLTLCLLFMVNGLWLSSSTTTQGMQIDVLCSSWYSTTANFDRAMFL